jgi:CheY-like chemotaxis protein
VTSPDTPVVLVVDDDEALLETYRVWLGDRCDLRTAASGEAALESLDEDVQVVLLDRMMPGLSGDEVLERIRQRDLDCRVAMVTAVEPDFDIADMQFDAYVSKALDRETVRETVDRLAARAEYDAVLQEHYRVAEKLAAIEARKPDGELATSEDYKALKSRFRELDEGLAERGTALDRQDIVGSVADIDPFGDSETNPESDTT